MKLPTSADPEANIEELLADPECADRLVCLATAPAVRELLETLELHAPQQVAESARTRFLAQCTPIERIPVQDGDVVIVHSAHWNRESCEEFHRCLESRGLKNIVVMVVPEGFRMQVGDRTTAEAYQVVCGLDP